MPGTETRLPAGADARRRRAGAGTPPREEPAADPTRQRGVRCAAVRQQCRTGLSACLDLVPVDGDYEIGSRREVTVDRAHANAGLGAMNFGSMGRTTLDEATAFTIVAAL
jgi:hypothetical protein